MKFNKKFSIHIDPTYEGRPDIEKGAKWGIITIGDFYEHFYMSPSIWKISDYEKQWELAWQRIKGHDTSCFIVNVQANPLIEIWALYKQGQSIYIQNYLMARPKYKNLIYNINTDNVFDLIPARETVTEDGEQVSEWNLQVIEE